MTKAILGIDKEKLGKWLGENSQASFRADQILQWIYARGVSNWDEMTNLSGGLRELLGCQWVLRQGKIVKTTA